MEDIDMKEAITYWKRMIAISHITGEPIEADRKDLDQLRMIFSISEAMLDTINPIFNKEESKTIRDLMSSY